MLETFAIGVTERAGDKRNNYGSLRAKYRRLAGLNLRIRETRERVGIQRTSVSELNRDKRSAASALLRRLEGKLRRLNDTRATVLQEIREQDQRAPIQIIAQQE